VLPCSDVEAWSSLKVYHKGAIIVEQCQQTVEYACTDVVPEPCGSCGVLYRVDVVCCMNDRTRIRVPAGDVVPRQDWPLLAAVSGCGC
jgi:hypothetical protein